MLFPLLFHSTNGLYYKCFMIVIYGRNDSGQYYKTRITIVTDDPSLSQCPSQPQLVSSITIVSDTTIWSITYDRHYDDRNGFIIQATNYKTFFPSSSLALRGISQSVGRISIFRTVDGKVFYLQPLLYSQIFDQAEKNNFVVTNILVYFCLATVTK